MIEKNCITVGQQISCKTSSNCILLIQVQMAFPTIATFMTPILTSSTIDKKLENFEFIFEFKIFIYINFEFILEIFCEFRV